MELWIGRICGKWNTSKPCWKRVRGERPINENWVRNLKIKKIRKESFSIGISEPKIRPQGFQYKQLSYDVVSWLWWQVPRTYLFHIIVILLLARTSLHQLQSFACTSERRYYSRSHNSFQWIKQCNENKCWHCLATSFWSSQLSNSFLSFIRIQTNSNINHK